MTRSTFLRSALASRVLPWIHGARLSTGAAVAAAGSAFTVSNHNHRLEFDRRTGGLLSFRAVNQPEQEFLPVDADLPAFVIQYLDPNREFQQLTSTGARHIEVAMKHGAVVASYQQLGGVSVDATVTVRPVTGAPASYWSIRVVNTAGLAITGVQFPFVVVRYGLGGKPGSEALLIPFWMGRLLQAPQPQQLTPDSPRAWQFRPETQATWHYPGMTTAQFLAYYDDRAGILVTSRDPSGSVKLIKAVHREPGIRLGMAHVGDWPAHGARELEYPVTLQAFAGDWYQAAEIYRGWSLGQPWARTPLHVRRDVPGWLLESPPHIMIRLQGDSISKSDPN